MDLPSVGVSTTGTSPSNVSDTRRMSVPQLDEGMLGLSGDPIALPASHASTPAGFTIVQQDIATGPMYVPSPSHFTAINADSPMALAFLHQQQQQAAAVAAAQLEHEYLQTRAVLQQCPRQVLLAVLLSLVDEYPATLVQPIHIRLAHLLNTRHAVANSSPMMNAGHSTAGAGLGGAGGNSMSSTGRGGANGMNASATNGGGRRGGAGAAGFVPNSAAAPWSPSNVHGSHAASTAGAGVASSTSPNHRKGRGHKNKEEEQEMCSVHRSLRAMKHLQLNPETGLYECIHGFHCLVDTPIDTSAKKPPMLTPALTKSTSGGGDSANTTSPNGSSNTSGTGVSAPGTVTAPSHHPPTPHSTDSSSANNTIYAVSNNTSSLEAAMNPASVSPLCVSQGATTTGQKAAGSGAPTPTALPTKHVDVFSHSSPHSGFSAHDVAGSNDDGTSPMDDDLKLDMRTLRDLLQSGGGFAPWFE